MAPQLAQTKGRLRAVVINLDRHSDRWEWVKKNFDDAGVVVERLTAVDAKDPGAQSLIDAILLPEAGLSGAEAACILSHRMAWQSLVESNDDYLAVFEDDVHIATDLRCLLDPALLQPGIDLVKLEVPSGKASYRYNASAAFAGRALHRLISKACGSGGYIVSRQCAKRLLDISRECDEPVDIILFDDRSPIWHEFGVFQVIPAACIQDSMLAKLKNEHELFSSAIEEDRETKKKKRHLGRRKIRKSVPFGKLGKYLRAVLQGAHPLHHKDTIPLELTASSTRRFINE